MSTVDNVAPGSARNGDPKANASPEEKATGDASGTPSATGVKLPEVGDPCKDAEGNRGVLAREENGDWKCVVTSA